MNRFKEKLRCLDFGSKTAPIYLILGKIRTFLKNPKQSL